jgi:hypothetical protein
MEPRQRMECNKLSFPFRVLFFRHSLLCTRSYGNEADVCIYIYIYICATFSNFFELTSLVNSTFEPSKVQKNVRMKFGIALTLLTLSSKSE